MNLIKKWLKLKIEDSIIYLNRCKHYKVYYRGHKKRYDKYSHKVQVKIDKNYILIKEICEVVV